MSRPKHLPAPPDAAAALDGVPGPPGAVPPADAAAAAREMAATEADRRGLRVKELTDVRSHHEAAALFRRIWRLDPSEEMLQPGLIRAFSHTGNYVAGALAGGELVGTGVGFLAADGHLHSHITGVEPRLQARGAGFCLKLHQRAWAMTRGISTVRWTFDPLVSRNAYFNLHKLGASATAYLADFYGPMADGINAGDASDRLYVTWDLAGPDVAATVAGRLPELDVAELVARGATVALAREGDEPVPTGAGPGPTTLVAMPTDVEALRAADPGLALRWREEVRAALQASLDAGLGIADATRDGWYVLRARSDMAPISLSMTGTG